MSLRMSPEAQRRYDELLRTATLLNGAVVVSDPSLYGWEDYKLTQHARVCALRSTATPREITFTEFAGTFASEDYTRHAVELKGVSCVCGLIKKRTMRWQTTVADALKAVLTMVLEKSDERTT